MLNWQLYFFFQKKKISNQYHSSSNRPDGNHCKLWFKTTNKAKRQRLRRGCFPVAKLKTLEGNNEESGTLWTCSWRWNRMQLRSLHNLPRLDTLCCLRRLFGTLQASDSSLCFRSKPLWENACVHRRHHKAQLGPDVQSCGELQGGIWNVISICWLLTLSVTREDKKNISVAPEDTRGWFCFEKWFPEGSSHSPLRSDSKQRGCEILTAQRQRISLDRRPAALQILPEPRIF